MAIPFAAHLTGLQASAKPVHLASLSLHEGYNSGWSATGVILGRRKGQRLTAGEMLGSVMASGVWAGEPMNLSLVVDEGPLAGEAVRTWPCVVGGLQPQEIDFNSAACSVHLADPVSYLASEPIWGAYRGVSAAEAVGGVLSLAAGGDGKPTLTPILPNLPSVRVVNGCRGELDRLPYVIAAGHTLGDWLADFLGMLGLRAELHGTEDGELEVALRDDKPRDKTLDMVVATPGAPAEEADAAALMGKIVLHGHAAFPGARVRAGLLDDPTKGSARPLAARGAVGTVLADTGLDIEEATKRIYQEAFGTFAEMLTLTAFTRQPLVRPGRLIRLDTPAHGLTDWQVTTVSHLVRDSAYDNDVTLIRGDQSWHPALPLNRPPVFVTAVVDGGGDFDVHEPVPRDRLGRIKVTFPFTPTPVGQAAAELAAADANLDNRVTLEDFDAEQIESFEEAPEHWEQQTALYHAGELDDPYDGRSDDDLTEEELANREALAQQRTDALSYLAYQKARGDRDHDGALTGRDELISEELSAEMTTREDRRALREQWETWSSLEGEELQTWLTATRLTGVTVDEELLAEYGELFGEVDEEEFEELQEDVQEAREEAFDAADHWPARIPLSVVMPMAGALHGFITAHRHGDTCRVAVHTPFHAEVVGFQYRDDRRINEHLSGTVAGLVVEHNFAEAWSGLVFRKVDDMETTVDFSIGDDLGDPDAQPDDDGQDTPSEEDGPPPVHVPVPTSGGTQSGTPTYRVPGHSGQTGGLPPELQFGNQDGDPSGGASEEQGGGSSGLPPELGGSSDDQGGGSGGLLPELLGSSGDQGGEPGGGSSGDEGGDPGGGSSGDQGGDPGGGSGGLPPELGGSSSEGGLPPELGGGSQSGGGSFPF